jgi:acyl-CoA synthetase (AMP-forming)/AMP-acid ligase II
LTRPVKLLIDVGGRKVNPLEVEAVLMQHPSVREAIVVAAPVTATINRLKAAIVLADGVELDEQDLRRFAKQSLSPNKVPRLIERYDALPRTAAGKVQRAALVQPC